MYSDTNTQVFVLRLVWRIFFVTTFFFLLNTNIGSDGDDPIPSSHKLKLDTFTTLLQFFYQIENNEGPMIMNEWNV